MAQEGLTLDALRQQLERRYIIQAVQQREILGQHDMTEEEARQYYDKHPDEFMKPATVTLREILVSVPTDPKNARAAGQSGATTRRRRRSWPCASGR